LTCAVNFHYLDNKSKLDITDGANAKIVTKPGPDLEYIEEIIGNF
jgi:hypothetical protein